MRTLALAVLLLILQPPTARAEPSGAQVAAICQDRSTCRIAKTYDGGRSSTPDVLTVVEARLGLKDKPDDAPDSGCRSGNDSDGGVEYWLIEGATPPRQILKLCNDGYGAAGIGDDRVMVGPNRLVHNQAGGSNWRWESTVTFTLSPLRAVSERDCGFHNAAESTGTTTDIDYRSLTARSLVKDATYKEGMGCPDWPAKMSDHLSARPGPGLLSAYNLVMPDLGREPNGKPLNVPPGTAIGDCVAAMTTSGDNGFIVFGTAASADKAARVKMLAESDHVLLIQVFDPLANTAPATPAGSWINLPHVEIWRGLASDSFDRRLPIGDLAQVSQVGVDLDGKVHAGVGKALPPPSVERWQLHLGAGHSEVLLRLQMAIEGGIAVVYSQAEGGRQARLVSTAGIVNNRPLYLPEITRLDSSDFKPKRGGCRVRNGLLSQQ